jgi:hypothetical protein
MHPDTIEYAVTATILCAAATIMRCIIGITPDAELSSNAAEASLAP